MAINGDGTSASPYVVHTWGELVEAVTLAKKQNEGNYVKLGNDITAPDEDVKLSSSTASSIDGDGYAIVNLYSTTSSIEFSNPANFTPSKPTVKNLLFKNVEFRGTYFINYKSKGGGNTLAYLTNCSIAGTLSGGSIVHLDNSEYVRRMYIDKLALNVEATGSSFKINDNITLWGDNNTPAFTNGNIKIDYINCSPTNLFNGGSSSLVRDSLFDLHFEGASGVLNFNAQATNCIIIGKGTGIKVPYCNAISFVESTIPLDNTSAALVENADTIDIKSAQYLHNKGFPIGVD